MNSFEKISQFLDSFDPADQNYDYANYVREKLAEYSSVESGASNFIEQDQDKDIEEQGELEGSDKAQDNIEGKLMEPSFKDLEEPEKIKKDEITKQSQTNYIRNFLDRLKQ
jgi:hypothetical protein